MLIKSTIILFFIVVAFAFMSVQAFGNPGLIVESAVQQGDSVIIRGQGFGSHPDNSPTIPDTLAAAYNDFESGQYNIGGFHLTSDYPENWQLVDGGTNRKGSRYYSKKYYNNGRLGPYYHYVGTNTRQVFSSFWFMMVSGTQSGKFSRLYADNNINVYFCSGDSDFMIRGEHEPDGGSETVWNSPDSFLPNVWHRVEILNEAGGNTIVWLDGKLQWTRAWLPGATNFSGHTYDIGNMINSGTGSYNFDDIYISYTVSRVELCDSSTWNDSSKRQCEIQNPNAWESDGTSITIRSNFGSFNMGETVYLYVIDSDGNVSNNGQGFQITLGAEGSSEAIKIPTNLEVVSSN